MPAGYFKDGTKRIPPSRKGIPNSPEQRKKISLALKGKKKPPRSEEHRRKISIGNKGKIISEWQKNRISQSQLGPKNHNWKNGISKSRGYRGFISKRREMRKRTNGGSFTLGEWNTLKAQYNWTCPCCKKKEPEIKLTIDHIIPISRGGSDNIENIQPLCMPCNSKKKIKIIKF